jgi:hypothetical protein
MGMKNMGERLRSRRLIVVIMMVGIAVIGSLTILLVIIRGGQNSISIPTPIAERALFPIYVPEKLPDSYVLTGTPRVSEEVLIFQIKNNKGHTITFSEQAKPKEFDFSTFHKMTLKESKSVVGAPYPSIIGAAEQRTTLLSIVTNDTWILVTTKAPDASTDLELLAKNILRQ